MTKQIVLLVLLMLLASNWFLVPSEAAEKSQQQTMLGIDANYVTTMSSFYRWRYHFQNIDIYSFFHSKGINYFRLRVFVKDNGSDSLPYAVNTARLVQAQGMNCSVTLFLSSDWSSISGQPAPSQWNALYDYGNLSLEHKADIVRNYTKNTTMYFLSSGIDADLYEIGNEIDYGFCGVSEVNITKQENISWMRNTTWAQMTTLINAAVAGVRSADPTSQFILHIAHWWDLNFSHAFFATMIDHGVPVDYLGLSFYPSSGIYNITKAYQGIGNGTLSQLLFRQTAEGLFSTLGRPIIVSEYAYPSSRPIIGPFKNFNHPVQGYPLTRLGQKAWLKEFLSWTANQSFIAGTFYFSPELYRIIWQPMSLFTCFGNAKPAVDAFGAYFPLVQ
jgi:arabinogalactan endo-1,4-beta-galactosidase